MPQYGLDPVTNFALGQLNAGIASGATSFVLTAGQGALFPDPATLGAYNITLWDSTTYANPSLDPNKEIFRITAKSTDTFTCVGAQESTSAADHNTALMTYSVSLSLTKKAKDDIETLANYGLCKQAAQNANFEIAQRGTTFTAPANGAGTLDRFRTVWAVDGGTAPTIVHSQQALTPGDIPLSFYNYRVNVNGAGSGFGVNSYNLLDHSIENGVRKLCGLSRQVTVSFRAKSSIASKKLGLSMVQVYGSGGSPTGVETLTGTVLSLTTSWARYSFTFSTNTLVGKTFGTANDDYLICRFGMQWGATFGAASFGATGGTPETFVGSGNIEIAQLQVNPGAFPFPFSPKSFGEELETCMRYYEKSFLYGTAPVQNAGFGVSEHTYTASLAGAQVNLSPTLYYKVPKRLAIVPTFYNPSATNGEIRNVTAAADLTGTAVACVTEKSVLVYGIGTAGTTVGQQLAFNWTVEDPTF